MVSLTMNFSVSSGCQCVSFLHYPAPEHRRELYYMGRANNVAQKVFSIVELHDYILSQCPLVKALKVGAPADVLLRKWKEERMTFAQLEQKKLKRRWLVRLLEVLRAGGISYDTTTNSCDRKFRLVVAQIYRLCPHKRKVLLSQRFNFAVTYNVLRVTSGMGGLSYA